MENIGQFSFFKGKNGISWDIYDTTNTFSEKYKLSWPKQCIIFTVIIKSKKVQSILAVHYRPFQLFSKNKFIFVVNKMFDFFVMISIPKTVKATI